MFLPLLAAPFAGALGWGISKGLEGAAVQNANEAAERNAVRNIELQREFAQHGIQWRVQDAKAAGLSPLAALGASGASFAPVSVGNTVDTSMSDLAGKMGQDISRAVHATSTEDQRLSATMKGLMLEKAGLENELLRSQILRANQGVGPAMPASNSGMPLLTGQGDSSRSAGVYVQEKPLERIHSSPGAPHQEVGAVPDYGFSRTPTGLAIVPSKDVKEKIEDQLIPELAWAVRNQILPVFGGGPSAPDPKYYPLPKGYDEWRFNPFMQEFQPARHGESFVQKWWNRR